MTRPLVFSKSSNEQFKQTKLDQFTCEHCEQPIIVLPEHIGRVVRCTKCETPTLVGDSLVRPRTPPKPKEVEDESAADPAPEPRVRPLFTKTFVCVALLMAISLGVAGYFTWPQVKNSEWLKDIGTLTKRNKNAEEEAAFDPQTATPEAIAVLSESDDPFDALRVIISWKYGLRKHDVPEDDERFTQLEAAKDKILKDRAPRMLEWIDGLAGQEASEDLLERARLWKDTLVAVELPETDARIAALDSAIYQLVEGLSPITTEMIEKLRKDSDPLDAIAQARRWEHDLRERNAPDDDPRFALLTEVVTELAEKASPPDLEKYAVQEYRRLLDELSSLLRDGDISGARAVVIRIDQIVRKYPGLFRELTERFEKLKEELATLASPDGGYGQVYALLERAQTATRSASSKGVTDAVRSEAKARFLSHSLHLTTQQANRLRTLHDQLQPRLQFAMGKRAVADAQACHVAGDIAGRNQQVKRAYELLPGLPESDIRPLLKQVEKWKDAKTTVSSDASSVGQQLARRDHLEAAMQAYGEVDAVAFADHAQAYYQAANSPALGADPMLRELQDMFLQMANHLKKQAVSNELRQASAKVRFLWPE